MKEGQGYYQYICMNGYLHECSNWKDIPKVINELPAFVPDVPPQPHSQDDHDYLDTFETKFSEYMSRCISDKNILLKGPKTEIE